MGYLYYVRKGLRFSVPLFVAMYFLRAFPAYGFDTIDFLIHASVYLLLGGPLWSYFMVRFGRKKNCHSS